LDNLTRTDCTKRNRRDGALLVKNTNNGGKPFKKSNDVGKMPLGVKITLIVGIVVACAFLEYGILIVSCMIDCSGYGFLALIFVVGGTTGVIFLCAHLIRTVLGRTRRQRFGKKDWGDNAQYSF